MSTSTDNPSPIYIPSDVQEHDPSMTAPTAEDTLTQANRVAGGVARSNKRDLATVDSASEASKDTVEEANAKKAATKDAIEELDNKAVLDIDWKHADDPQYATTVAPQLFSFLRHYESLALPGTRAPIKTAKSYDKLQEMRMRCLNQMFGVNAMYTDPYYRVSTETIHLAMYYLDRFLERYDEEKTYPMALIALTSLFTASKYEDVDPVPVSSYAREGIFGSKLDRTKVLEFEIIFQKTLFILTGPTSTAFALRFLQAVDLETNTAAVHTARYFCALGISIFGLSGEYYSKIGAAAAFISYNKYSPKINASVSISDTTTPPRVEYPQNLFIHSEYSARDVQHVVLAMIDMAVKVEGRAQRSDHRKSYTKDEVPINVYKHYKQVGVVATHILPDFRSFFESIAVDERSVDSEPIENNEGATERAVEDL